MSQVKLEHGTWYREDGSWDLDVEHTFPRCDESRHVSIGATVTGM